MTRHHQLGAALQRRLVLSALAALPAVGLPILAWAQAMRPTPRQTLGPFYPRNAGERPAETDADLIRVVDGRVLTLGTPLYLTGRILDAGGAPMPDATIEIWQCDAKSIYHHPAGGGEAARDPNFQGYGAARSDASGVYRFRTILPVAYPGRTPHIHVRVAGPRTAFATQLYLSGAAENERDFLYRSLDAADRAAITLTPAPTTAVEHPLAQHTRLTMRADLVLG
jgi:protocatechuate 3,4-dioxygenase beta subunit